MSSANKVTGPNAGGPRRSVLSLATSLAMRPVALLCVLFGGLGQMVLDGQVFTHAVLAIVFGLLATICGLLSAGREPQHRHVGWGLGFLGAVVTLWGVWTIPGSYERQQRFNGRQKRSREQVAVDTARLVSSVEGTTSRVGFPGGSPFDNFLRGDAVTRSSSVTRGR